MLAGRLKDRITIHRKTILSQNSMGEDQVTWDQEVYGPLSAQFVPAGGREFNRFQQRFTESKIMFKIRYQPGLVITGEDRLYWQNRRLTFDILGIDEVSRQREVAIFCKELPA